MKRDPLTLEFSGHILFLWEESQDWNGRNEGTRSEELKQRLWSNGAYSLATNGLLSLPPYNTQKQQPWGSTATEN